MKRSKRGLWRRKDVFYHTFMRKKWNKTAFGDICLDAFSGGTYNEMKNGRPPGGFPISVYERIKNYELRLF